MISTQPGGRSISAAIRAAGFDRHRKQASWPSIQNLQYRVENASHGLLHLLHRH
jgi:hypothetical protein